MGTKQIEEHHIDLQGNYSNFKKSLKKADKLIPCLKSIQYLKDNPVLANKIEQAIRESHFEPTFSRLQNEDEPENHEVIPLDV